MHLQGSKVPWQRPLPGACGLIRHFEMEEQLPQALELSARAEKLFPDSGRIMGAVHDARQAAITAGILPPDDMEA